MRPHALGSVSSIFAQRTVRIAVQPVLTGLSRCDDRMLRGAGMFSGVTIWRAVAAEGHAARLAGAQMDPV